MPLVLLLSLRRRQRLLLLPLLLLLLQPPLRTYRLVPCHVPPIWWDISTINQVYMPLVLWLLCALGYGHVLAAAEARPGSRCAASATSLVKGGRGSIGGGGSLASNPRQGVVVDEEEDEDEEDVVEEHYSTELQESERKVSHPSSFPGAMSTGGKERLGQAEGMNGERGEGWGGHQASRPLVPPLPDVPAGAVCVELLTR